MSKHAREEADEADVGPPRPSADDSDSNDGEDDVVGPPRPTDVDRSDPEHDGSVPRKKRRQLEFEQLFLGNLPSCEMYEKSYMHRDVVTDVLVTSNDFVITASCDGQVKFWKKAPASIDFVKHFRSHVGLIRGMAASVDGAFLATVAEDQSLKMYDIVNFDMISMVKLAYQPSACEWVSRKGAADGVVAVAADDAPAIRLYRARSGSADPVGESGTVHFAPVRLMRYNHFFHTVVSMDTKGMVEYWDPDDFSFPERAVRFSLKSETSLYEFCKKKTKPTSLAFSADGTQFVCMAEDRHVRVFNFQTGKLRVQYDEGPTNAQRVQQQGEERYHLDPMEFGRRMAVEQSIEQPSNAIFDESGHFIIYSTMLGIKIINTHSHQVSRLLGKVETNERFVRVALYQGKPKPPVGQTTVLAATENDPTIFCTSHKKSRFFYFSDRDPAEEGRDVFNERPTQDDL
jgi:peptidylprolyl isomerase domain and WD repeat-containing protein 1